MKKTFQGVLCSRKEKAEGKGGLQRRYGEEGGVYGNRTLWREVLEG